MLHEVWGRAFERMALVTHNTVTHGLWCARTVAASTGTLLQQSAWRYLSNGMQHDNDTPAELHPARGRPRHQAEVHLDEVVHGDGRGPLACEGAEGPVFVLGVQD